MGISLAQLIRESRLRQDGMTQAGLAKMVGSSEENITAIENERNRQPSPQLIGKLSQALGITAQDIYAAIAGTLNRLPWEKVGDLDLKDPELELMFRQVDDLLEEEAKDSVKDFIRFTLDRERRRRRQETEQAEKQEKG